MKELDNIFHRLLTIIESKSLLFFAYFLIVFSDIFDNISRINIYLNIIDILIIFLLSLIIIRKIHLEKIEYLKNNYLLVLFLLISIISSFVSQNKSILKLSFLLLASVNIDFDEFIKKDLYIRITLIISIMFFYFAGLADIGVVEYRNGLMRNAFGMGHPNSFAFYLTMICIDSYYLNFIKEKSNILIPIIISVALMIFNYFFLGSRTNIFMVLIVSFVFLFMKQLKIPKPIELVSSHSFTIMLFTSFLLGYFYTDNSFFGFVNNLLSNRLYLSNIYLNQYNISIFGNFISYDTFYVLDNAYLNILLRFGLLFTIVFSLLFIKTFKKLFKYNKYILVCILIALLIFGISESPIYIPAKNPYILLFAMRLRCGFMYTEEN